MPDGLFILAALGPAGEIIGRAIGEALDGLDVVLAKRNQHRSGDTGHFADLVGDAERLALGVKLGFDLLEMLTGPGLNLGRGVLVEALDRTPLPPLS